jgi:hypothetical protein
VTEVRFVAAAPRHGGKLTPNTESTLALSPTGNPALSPTGTMADRECRFRVRATSHRAQPDIRHRAPAI